jgi:hypothetical protein
MAYNSGLKEMSMNHDIRPLTLLFNVSCTLLNAAVSNKQLTKYLKAVHASVSNRHVAN